MTNDVTPRVFQVNYKGDIRNLRHCYLGNREIGVIDLDPTGEHLEAVAEDGNEVVKAEISRQSVLRWHGDS